MLLYHSTRDEKESDEDRIGLCLQIHANGDQMIGKHPTLPNYLQYHSLALSPQPNSEQVVHSRSRMTSLTCTQCGDNFKDQRNFSTHLTRGKCGATTQV